MWTDSTPTVISSMIDGYQVVTYMNATEEMVKELKKTVANRPHINQAEKQGEPISIPLRPTGETTPGPEGSTTPALETVPRTEWLDIVKAAQDAQKAADKAQRITDRKTARQAAAQALKAAKTGNFLGLEPKTDQIVITSTAATTVDQIAAGGLTSEGEAVQ